jgi:Na+/melibiose symporter-like transporter
MILTTFGYIQGGNLAVQPESAFLGIKIIWLLISGIVAALGLVSIYYYPLHGEKLENMQRNLRELHKQKREAIMRPGQSTVVPS